MAATGVGVLLAGTALAGCHRPYEFGDLVWLDLDEDGLQDDGEPGIAGVEVEACSYTQSRDYECLRTATDDDGRWVVRIPSSVRERTSVEIWFESPAGYIATISNVGDDDNIDSDGRAVLLGPYEHDLAGTEDHSIDFGLIRPDVTVGDFVWHDLDRDGFQDLDEPGVEGISVALYETADEPVARTVTDEDGRYHFGPVPGGAYYVEFGPLPGGVAFTRRAADDDFLRDSDADPATGRTEVLELVSSTWSVDAGLVSDGPIGVPGRIGDLAWWDDDGDGLQRPDEEGVGGLLVELLDVEGLVVDETLTDPDGRYRFDEVRAGTYRVRFRLPSRARFTQPDVGPNDALDSDADQSGLTRAFALRPGESDFSIDAGIQNLPS